MRDALLPDNDCQMETLAAPAALLAACPLAVQAFFARLPRGEVIDPLLGTNGGIGSVLGRPEPGSVAVSLPAFGYAICAAEAGR